MRNELMAALLLLSTPAWAGHHEGDEQAEAKTEDQGGDAKDAKGGDAPAAKDAPKTLTEAERARLLGLMDLPLQARDARKDGVPEQEVKETVAEAGKGSKTAQEVQQILQRKREQARKGGNKVGQERGAGNSGEAAGKREQARSGNAAGGEKQRASSGKGNPKAGEGKGNPKAGEGKGNAKADAAARQDEAAERRMKAKHASEGREGAGAKGAGKGKGNAAGKGNPKSGNPKENR
jgi:hypothetical protein